MNWQTWVALVAAVVSVASVFVNWWLQWWQRGQVKWLVDGYVTQGVGVDVWNVRSQDVAVIRLQLVNCGDAPAYGVETRRWHADASRPFTVFEAGAIPAGGMVEVTMVAPPDRWTEAWLEPRYRPSPTRRSMSLRTGARFYLGSVLADVDRRPPGFDPTDTQQVRRRFPAELAHTIETS